MGRLVLLAVFAFVGCSEPSGAGGGGGSAGMGGEDTGDGGNGGDGTVIECRTEDDCTPGRGNCNVRLAACVDGACVVKPLPDGSICQASGAGECMDRVGTCVDGACVATPLADGTACTADFEQCTEDVCLAGVCEHPAFEDETPCDEDNECTAMGACTSAECIATPVENGTLCAEGAGTCRTGRCSATFACTEAGIREAIAVGGGPHTFDCEGPTTVAASPFLIDRDLVLDGEGDLILDPGDFRIVAGATVVLRGLTVLRGGQSDQEGGGAIENDGSLTLEESTVSQSYPRSAIWSAREGSVLRVERSSIVDNPNALGIVSAPETVIQNSTVTGNQFDVLSQGEVLIVSSTIGRMLGDGSVTIRASLLKSCSADSATSIASNGWNIESTTDTCGFDQPTDQVNVSSDDLKLGALADNGGPTETHALGAGSVAIDAIAEEDCVDADGEPLTTDQRGLPRGTTCDVGAFEVQP